jgi:hypothetical protein
MEADERHRRLQAYGFADSGLDAAPVGESDGRRPGDGDRKDGPGSSDAGPVPSTLARIRDSWGFRYGLVVLLLAFVVSVLFSWDVIPEGPLESVAAAFVTLSLAPSALSLWLGVGVLAPPAPFRTGAFLGLIGSALWLLTILVVAEDFWLADLGPGVLLVVPLITVVASSLAVGIVGWVVRRVFMPPEARLPFREQPTLEPRARPWPPVVIAVLYTCIPLGVLAPASTEWAFAAVFASVFTGAMIVGGLAVQRRYPERRTPVVVVGLVAGIIAGLAMLQAMWSASMWPGRRRSSDMLAIGVSVAVIVAATYFAAGESLRQGPAWVVEPAGGIQPGQDEVQLASEILEDRLAALAVEARVAVDDEAISVRVGSDTDEALVRQVLGAVGRLEFKVVPPRCIDDVVQDEPEPACLEMATALFDGSEVVQARIARDPVTAETVVAMEFGPTGARRFDEHAERVFASPDFEDDFFAIVLDGIVESAPSINAPRFGGQATISGDFTVEEAAALVAALRAGRSLPYPVQVSLEA